MVLVLARGNQEILRSQARGKGKERTALPSYPYCTLHHAAVSNNKRYSSTTVL
jgi:hypothetical protein